MIYHASPVKGLKVLIPHTSNHGTPLVYFSQKRENVLVYLSNAVEKFCTENGTAHTGPYKKWASYGFESGILRIEEYYPDALAETYKGVSGYIYRCRECEDIIPQSDIPFAFISSAPVIIEGCEFVVDAYEEILKAESQGKIKIQRYRDMTDAKLRWIQATVQNEYLQNRDHPEYRAFLKAKFPEIISGL